MSLAPPKIKAPAPLQQILHRKDLWRGINGPSMRCESITTGYSELDKNLLHKGWPARGLIEFQQQSFGHGEWHLLLPSLRNLLQEAGYIALINPPFIPYAPALVQQGIDPQRLLVVQPAQKADWLVGVREVLSANCCIALLSWESEQRLLYPELRKLQLASNQNDTLSFLLRKNPSAKNKAYSASPAVLRLLLQSSDQGLKVFIDKQRGSYRRAQVLLPWLSYLSQGVSAEQQHSVVNLQDKGRNNVISFKGGA